MTHRPPLGASTAWKAVMEAADNQCQCTGACGSQHTKTGLRCPKGTSRARLIIAPGDLTLSPVAAADVPAEHLRAWCTSCHSGAQRRQLENQRELERHQFDEPLSLF